MAFAHRDLWDTKYLKSSLAARSVSEGKAFACFFALTAFDWLQFTSFRLSVSAGPIESWARADTFITLALTGIGLPFLFWRNGGSRGRDFFYRYFPLAFVVGWKTFIIGSFAVWLLVFALQGCAANVVGWASTAAFATVNLAMFWRIGFHLRELSRVSGTRSSDISSDAEIER